MKREIVILGGGTGGTLAANRLRRLFPRDEARITVVDEDNRHIYQPGLLFVPFGLANPGAIVRDRAAQFHGGIDFRRASVDSVDTAASQVRLEDGNFLPYDALIIATGAHLAPDETPGLDNSARNVGTFYNLSGSERLRDQLAAFDGGELVVNVVDMPIKCPVAPLEFCFLADWYFQQRGLRDRVTITFVTPLDGAFTKPVCNSKLSFLLQEKGINLVTEFNTGEVETDEGRLVSYDNRSVPFDLAVVVPVHVGADYVGRSSGLGDEMNFVRTDKRTLRALSAPNIFVIGDAADIPTSKAGSVADFEGHLLAENVRRQLDGKPLLNTFDGHTNCFIETGFGKALLIDFNYDTEPLPGHYPWYIGLPLLKESSLNHLGKRMFEQFYWHILLPGRDVPGIGSTMPVAGKERGPAVAKTA